MKRIFSIVLLSIFIFSTVGVVANCYSCSMKEMKAKMCYTHGSCCKHEVKVLKVKDDFIPSVSQDTPKKFSSSFSLVAISAPVKKYFLIPHLQFFDGDHAPPVRLIERLSLIQSFLI